MSTKETVKAVNGRMKCLSRYNSTFFGRKTQAKFENDCISRNGHRIKITQPDSMILVSFSSAEDVLSTDVNSMTLFARKWKIRRSAFWDTRYRIDVIKDN